MRESAIVLLLVIATACDRNETEAGGNEVGTVPQRSFDSIADEPAASAKATTPVPDTVTPAPDEPKATTQPSAVAPGPVVLKMADGSGEPVQLGTLRDVHGLPVRLPGHTLVELATGYQLRAAESVALEIHAPPSQPSRFILTFRTPSIVTADGIALGQRFSDLKDRVPALKCYPSGGADGTLVSCDAGEGTTATFHLSKSYVELPEPMTLAQAEAAIGNKTITELSWFSDAVPEPVSTTQPAARARHGVLPAGVYWVGGGYSACDLELVPELCIAAGAAVVAGIFDDPKTASQALAAVDASALEPGYPLVVHTDEIHPQDGDTKGIAIVLALFAAEPEAKDWASGRAKTEIVTLKSPSEIAAARTNEPERKAVVRLRSGATLGKGACPLEGGTFTVIAADELHDDVYERVPARCEDGSATTLPWRDTLVKSVVVRTKDGPQLVQLVGAQCDQPQWRRWAWAADQVAKGKGTQVGKHGKC